MVIDLRELLEAPGEQRSYDLDAAFPDLSGIELVSPVKGTLTIRNSRHHIVIDGRVRAAIHQECSRCLCEMESELDVAVEAFCPVEITRGGVAGRLAPEDDEQAALFGPTRLFVDELVRQTLLPATPMKSVCRDDCRGICAQCGVNLNEENCRCPRHPADPRLAVLRDMMAKISPR